MFRVQVIQRRLESALLNGQFLEHNNPALTWDFQEAPQNDGMVFGTRNIDLEVFFRGESRAWDVPPHVLVGVVTRVGMVEKPRHSFGFRRRKKAGQSQSQ